MQTVIDVALWLAAAAVLAALPAYVLGEAKDERGVDPAPWRGFFGD